MSLPKVTDRTIEKLVGAVLRSGVLISGSVVLLGAVYYIVRHGAEAANYRIFQKPPSIDRIVAQIVAGALALRARSIIQLGLLLLIATPIARVAVSLIGFAIERDQKY